MIFPEKIKQARELRRLTQQELSARLGLDRSAIGQMEIGLYDATPHLQSLAFATTMLPAFFEDGLCDDFPAGSLQYRSRASMIRRVDRAEAHRLGQTLFQTYRRMAIRLRLPAPKVPRLDDAEPAEAAALVRSTMGLSPDTPIKHLINSVERLGVVVLGLPTSLPHRDAFSVWAGDMPVIALSAGLPGDRIRFTVAHELGHLAQHQSPRGIVTALEGAANEFASALLLPMPTIAEELAEGVTLSRLAVLKARWGVSIQTLARKARDLDLLTERQYHGVFEQLARMGYGRKSEPGPIAVEKPRALRQMAERLYGVPLDYPRFAADSKLPQAFLRDIMNAHAEGRAASPPAAGKLLTMKR